MSNNDQDKILSEANSSKRCSVCETYQRKIDDVEQSLSGRDQIITILQGRLKKCETNYKNLFDEFEKLRFEHCTALQDNYSLKEINAKLEEFDLKNKGNDLRCSCSQVNRNINCNNFDNKRQYQDSNSPVNQEVSHIETLVTNQNQVLKQLLDKIIKELKSCKCDSPEISHNIDKIQEDFKSIESGDHLNVDPKLIELTAQVESLNKLLVKCQEENDSMKKILTSRKNNFSECHNILQHTSRSINKISDSIDDLVKSKTTVKMSKETSCCTSDQEPPTLSDGEKQIYETKISELEHEVEEKDKDYEACRCRMLSQMHDVIDNNQILSETLEIIKAENKNNLEALAKLTDELKKVNEENEIKQREMKSRITQLENELEEHYIKEKQLRSSLEESSSNETTERKEKSEVVCREDQNLQCKCKENLDSACKMKQKLEELECTCGEMEKDLTEKTLELSEYEEENQALKQKIECVMSCNDSLKKRVDELEDQLSTDGEEQFAVHQASGYLHEEGRCLGDECLIERLNTIVKMQEITIKKLTKKNEELTSGDRVKKSSHLGEEGRCLGDDCYLGHKQKLQEIERLNDMLKMKDEEIKKLTRRNEELSVGDMVKKSSHMVAEGRCLGDDCYLGQMQKLQEIENLKNIVKTQEEEIYKLTKRNEELSLGDMVKKSSHMVAEGRCLGDDCYLGQMQKLQEIENLNSIVKTQEEEIRKLKKRIEELSLGDMMIKSSHVVAEGRCLGDDCHFGQREKLKEIERLNNMLKMKDEEINKMAKRIEELSLGDIVQKSSHEVQEVRCLGDDCHPSLKEKLKDIEGLNDMLIMKDEEIKKLTRRNEELSVGDMVKKSSLMVAEGRCLGDDCYLGQKQKLQEIERLNNMLKMKDEEINRMSKRIEKLSLGDIVQKSSHEVQEVRCLGDDCHPSLKEKLKDIEGLNDMLKMKDEEIKKLTRRNEELSVGDMVKKSSLMVAEGRCLGDDCYLGQKQKLQEIERLNNMLKMKDEEINRMSKRIEKLSLEDIVQKSSHEVQEVRCLGDDCHPSLKEKLKDLERLNDMLKMKDEEIKKLTKRIEELSLGEMVRKSSYEVQEVRCLGDDCHPSLKEKLKDIEGLNDMLKMKDEEIKKLTKRIEELSVGDMVKKSSHMVAEGRCLSDDCYLGQKEKLKEIERLSSIVKMQNEQINKQSKRIEELILGGMVKKSSPFLEEGRCLGDDCYLGHKQKLHEIERLNKIVKMQAEEIKILTKKNQELSIGDLMKKSSHSVEEGRCLGDDCYLGHKQKSQELERLTKVVKRQKEEIGKLSQENDELRNERNERSSTEIRRDSFDGPRKKLMEIEHLTSRVCIQKEDIVQLQKENIDLRYQIERLKSENKKETERLQGLVNHSQRQVEMLLKEHDEKTAQIQSVANELDGIRRSVTEENDNFLLTIEDLKRERDELRQTVEEFNNESNICKCDKNPLEIERLKAEVFKKQCVVLELEKSIDTFNCTMKQFEQNIESLACENATLKEDKEKQLKDLENVRTQLAEKVAELGQVHEQLNDAKRTSESCCQRCKCLEIESEKLKDEIDRLKKDNERTRRSVETEKLELEMEVASLKEEHNAQAAKCCKLENCQNAYEELRNQCAKKCFDMEKLQEELHNKNKIIEDLKAKSESLHCECDKLKNQNRANVEEQYKLGQKMASLQECCEKITRQYTAKCLENDDLLVTANERRTENSQSFTDCEEFKKKLAENEKELEDATEKCRCLQRDYDQKCQEFRKLKKQYDSCSKQSQISREEYNNLRKEYKEISKMLANQIKKYRKETDSVEAGESSENKQCKVVFDLRTQLLEKEKEILGLQQKLKDSSYEIIELKDYIHKLISDNNILKSAINNLIGNLERKIKGPNTADALAGEILQSLTNIESTIIRKSQNQCSRPGCMSKECDCMSQIQSQYVKESEHDNGETCSDCNVQEKSSDVPIYHCNETDGSCPAFGNIKPPNTDRHNKQVEVTYRKELPRKNCAQGPNKGKNKSPWSDDFCIELIQGNFGAQPATNVISDMSTATTDSDDGPCCSKFLDKQSVDFLKETIQGLKISKDNIMKEKSCDCERF